MDKSLNQLQQMGLMSQDELVESSKRFQDGAQYRIEIPSTEGPEAFKVILEQADQFKCPIHRVSQGSGIQMLTDDEIREMARIGQDHHIEVCLFVTARASYDTGGLSTAPAGGIAQWQIRGANQLRYGLDDINRVVDLGIRSVLIADTGLIQIVDELRKKGELPENLVIKSSASFAPANAASVKILEQLGANTINLATDLSIAQVSTIRQAINVPIDMYIEAPDSLGGFVRHQETPDLIRYAAPFYVKMGVRNAPDIYPSGYHLRSIVLELSRERVRRAKLVYDLILREYPDAVISTNHASDLGVPER